MSSGDLMKSPYSGRAMSPVMSQKNQSQQNQMRRQIAFLMHEAKTAHTNAAKCMDLANAAKDAASPIRSLSSDQLGHPPVAEAIKSMLMCVQECNDLVAPFDHKATKGNTKKAQTGGGGGLCGKKKVADRFDTLKADLVFCAASLENALQGAPKDAVLDPEPEEEPPVEMPPAPEPLPPQKASSAM